MAKAMGERLDWQGKPAHRTGWVVADKGPYDGHGIRVLSWHRSGFAAQERLACHRRQGNGLVTVYELMSKAKGEPE